MAKHRKKSTRKMSRGALTTFVGLGVVAAGLPAAVQASAAPLDESVAAARTPIKVVQHNTDQIRSSFQKVVALGGTHDLLLAEEVCETWVKDVKAAHPAWTVSFHRQKITHRPTTEKPNQRLCAGDSKWKGVVAIHSGAGKASAQEFSFYGAGQSPDPDQDFGMACVKFTKGGTDVHGCATHLQVYGDDDMSDRTHQTGRIKQITDPWIAKGDSAIVGGDFNAKPNSAPHDEHVPARRSGRVRRGGPAQERQGGAHRSQHRGWEKDRLCLLLLEQDPTQVRWAAGPGGHTSQQAQPPDAQGHGKSSLTLRHQDSPELEDATPGSAGVASSAFTRWSHQQGCASAAAATEQATEDVDDAAARGLLRCRSLLRGRATESSAQDVLEHRLERAGPTLST